MGLRRLALREITSLGGHKKGAHKGRLKITTNNRLLRNLGFIKLLLLHAT